jgi:Fe2+ or Zn2+ uptake regulation protein
MLRDYPAPQEDLGEVPEEGFQVTGYRLELLGYCAACRQRQNH